MPARKARGNQAVPARQAVDEADITALPQDSSDDENEEDEENDLPEELRVEIPTKPSPPKRKPTKPAATRKSKRSKLTDGTDVTDAAIADIPMVEPRKASQGSEVNMKPSASQKRRGIYKRPQDVPPPQRPQKAGSGVLKTTINLPNAVASNNRSPKVLKVQEAVESVPLRRELKLPSTDITSSATVESSGASQATSTSERPQSTPSSPATTPISVGDEQNDNEEDEERKNTCPYCEKEVNRSRLETYVNLNELRYAPLRQQQQFCHEHSLADARALYEEKKYPSMKWPGLPARISKKIPKLKQMLERGVVSHFLEQIDGRLANKRNRKQMRQFLDQQGKDIDAFPPGYYGPKGTQIMAEVIASKLSNNLSGNDVDATLKTLGVGPYVALVLVPECTTLLVMQDMKVTEEEARVIMAESSQAGILLHPEDEVVLRQDEED